MRYWNALPAVETSALKWHAPANRGRNAIPIYEKGPVRIHYTEMGSGFPLMIIPGRGLNSTIAGLDVKPSHPFNAQKEFSNAFRCIAADIRNANAGQSTGPLDIERTWDAITDDHVGLMDHLGIKKFMVLGYCIGQPLIWNLIKRVGDRVVAAVLTQPSGFRPELPTQFYDNNMKGWGAEFVKKRPEYTMDHVSQYLTNMYTKKADFVFTVDRDFVRNCQTPILVAPDDSPPHPYKVAMEVAMLSPNSQVTLYPWKVSPETVPHAVRHIRMFLEANRPAAAASMGQRAAAD